MPPIQTVGREGQGDVGSSTLMLSTEVVKPPHFKKSGFQILCLKNIPSI